MTVSDKVSEKLNELARAIAKDMRDKAIAETAPITRERLMLKIEAIARADRRRSKK